MHLLYVIDRCFIFPSHLCYCITTTLEITEHEFTNLAPCSNRVLTSLGNSGLCWTVFAKNSDTVVPAERNGDLQTLTCVLVARPRQCLTLSNPVPWQNWMADYLGYTLRMKTLFRGWPVMAHEIHTRSRKLMRSMAAFVLRDNRCTHATTYTGPSKCWPYVMVQQWSTRYSSRFSIFHSTPSLDTHIILIVVNTSIELATAMLPLKRGQWCWTWF